MAFEGLYSLFSVTKKGDKKVKNVPFYRVRSNRGLGAGRSPRGFSLAILVKIRGTTAPDVLGGSRGFALAKPKLPTPPLPQLPPFLPKKITLSCGKCRST